VLSEQDIYCRTDFFYKEVEMVLGVKYVLHPFIFLLKSPFFLFSQSFF